jgi:hypothetical protein
MKVQYSVKQKVTEAVDVRTGMSWVRPTCERAMFALRGEDFEKQIAKEMRFVYSGS